MFQKFIIFVLLPVLLFGLVVRTIDLIAESREQGFLVPVVAVMVGFVLFIVGVIYVADRKLKKKAQYITQLRSTKPVAYVCSYPFSSTVHFISSDETDITIWNVDKGELVPEAVVKRESLKFSKGTVPLAAARSTQGLMLTDKTDPSVVLLLNLCRDKINLTLSPMKEPMLSEAISRLQNGK